VDHSEYRDAVSNAIFIEETSISPIGYGYYVVEWHRRMFVGILALLSSIIVLFGLRGLRIAVGTLIAERPPHRSVRARFGHTAPTSGV
jgi:hypothetical protein